MEVFTLFGNVAFFLNFFYPLNQSFIIKLKQDSILLLGAFAGEVFYIVCKYFLDSRPNKLFRILEHNALTIVDEAYYQKLPSLIHKRYLIMFKETL